MNRIAKDGSCNKTKTPHKAKKETAAPSKSNKMELESSPEQLEILTVKEHNGQIMIEYRASNTSAKSIAGTDCEPRSNQTNTKGKVEDEFEFCGTSITQSITTAGAEPQNYQTVHDGSTIIKVNDEVDIKIEDEMEFCALNSSAHSILGTDDEDHNQAIQDQFSEIKVEDEIEFGEPVISVQSIPTNGAETQKYRTIHDEFAEIEDEMQCGDEEELDELNTLETTVANKPDISERNKQRSEFTCNICSKKFSMKYYLNKHRVRHGKPNFPCTICDADKFSQFELDRHMRVHDTKSIYFACDFCPKKYSSKSYLIGHMTTHDPNAKFYPCEICSKEFPSKKRLNQHRLRHGKPKFHCTICDVARFRQYDLDKHMRVHDTIPIFFTCDLCPKKYSSKDYLVTHMKTHDTNLMHLTCDICSKKFSTEKTMINHRNRHGKPNFNCNVCGVAKFSQFDLNRHMRSHDTKLVNTCKICWKKFSKKENLVTHMKTHNTTPIYFTCDLCPKKSTSKKYMVTHRKTHDTKPTCEICSKIFSTKGNLGTHMKKIHDTLS